MLYSCIVIGYYNMSSRTLHTSIAILGAALAHKYINTLYTILSTEYDGVSSDIDTLNVIAGTTL